MRRRLREIKSSTQELAEAIEVPVSYVDDVIAGSRSVAPSRSDVYSRMTSFLRLGRNDLLNCLPPDRPVAHTGDPDTEVRRLLLGLCEPATAARLDRRTSERAVAELTEILRRLLEVAQGAVRRVLDDHVQLRLAASERRMAYPLMRLRVLDFLEATPSTLTPDHIAEFVAPRIARWDVELPDGVLRVVMSSADRRRAPRGRAVATAAHAPAPRFDGDA